MITCDVPLLGFCAFGSGIGKTTLLTSLIPVLTARGLNLSVIKHAHHTFDIDHPGKDSYRIREAGAVQTMLGSRRRWALMTEMSRISDREDDLRLAELLPQAEAFVIPKRDHMRATGDKAFKAAALDFLGRTFA